jgi:protein-disulfide isomerase
MFRILLILATIGVAYILYDAYGYRYYLNQIKTDIEGAMMFGDTIDSDIDIIAYYDYESPASRRLYPVLLNLASRADNVRVIMRPVATESAISNLTTRVAIAAKNQNRFMDFNNIILSASTSLDENYIERAVLSLGLDYNQIKFDIASEDIDNTVAQYQREAALLNIQTLPFFYINHVKMPGTAYTVQEIENIIRDVRTGRL